MWYVTALVYDIGLKEQCLSERPRTYLIQTGLVEMT